MIIGTTTWTKRECITREDDIREKLEQTSIDQVFANTIDVYNIFGFT